MKTSSTNPPISPRTLRTSQARRWGFSLMELLIVLAVTVMLTGLLLPALQHLRENVNRVVCSSNQRQVGMAISLFATDSRRDMLPHSVMLDPNGTWKPQELMAAWQGGTVGWDGLGLLYEREYCGAFECFYCPSHRGEHPMQRYAAAWAAPGLDPIYTNMHYAGNRDWSTKQMRYYANLDELVLVTDGMRSASDLNHKGGMNVLYGDISVRWRQDLAHLATLLPSTMSIEEGGGSDDEEERYSDIWDQLSPNGLK